MPKTHVSRSIDIAVPIENVFDRISDFHQWRKWSPWLFVEPDCKLTYREDGSGNRWEGDLIGCGEIERLDIRNPESMTCELRIEKPWKSVSTVEFQLESIGDGCRVTWTLDGSLPLPMLWLKPMLECIVGMDYIRGLTMLKDLCETGTVPSVVTLQKNESFPGCQLIGVRTTCSMTEIGPSMERDLLRLHGWMDQEGISPSAPPISIYHKWKMGKGLCVYTIGFPVKKLPDTPPAEFVTLSVPSTSAFVVEHTGPYRHLGNAWAVGMTHERAKRFPRNKNRDPFEIYVNDPTITPEDQIVTRIYFPQK
ncbi:MAG: SRPBCC family protein [Kiritimatiellae bacterium]|jgi:predicted transcriptional regulator YdeE|nr:SRPBCC family protein [Kiritimatiellia bacterium]